jgi:hypothetical protein
LLRGAIAAGALVLLLTTTAGQAASHDADFKRIEDSLKRRGPEATLKKYFGCDNDKAWALIDSGDPRAVKIGLAFLPVADACYSEVLSVSLGYALTNNPALMLGYQKDYPEAFPEWCVPGLIGPTQAEWTAAINKAEKAIRSVSDPKLDKAKQICLKQVADSRKMPAD